MSWRRLGGGGARANDDDGARGNGRWLRGRSPARPGPAAADRDHHHQQQHQHQQSPRTQRRGAGPQTRKPAASTWDLKAQRRERGIWSEGMRALEGLFQAAGGAEQGGNEEAAAVGRPDDGPMAEHESLRAAMAAMDKALDELSTVSWASGMLRAWLAFRRS
jgi:hypothetical protein